MNEVLIPWNAGDTVSKWSDLCARVVDHFGLPGNKYITELDPDWMKFKFNDEKDALLCQLMLSEHTGHYQSKKI